MARRQLVCALQVHVAVGGAERSLAVYNALRPWLPAIAALAANAPYHDGRDTGMASIRPKLSELLPRQGIPPAISSWEAFADALRWGAASGAVPVPGRWWWELRPHPAYGTLEMRVPDAQATVADAAAVTALVVSLVAWLAERHAAGAPAPAPDSWRLAENRWSAARWGLDAELADLDTGARTPVREILAELLETLAPHAGALGCTAELAGVRRLMAANGAVRQREAGGAHAATAWLANAYVPVGDYAAAPTG
jgi:carboxylate-amine ligase